MASAQKEHRQIFPQPGWSEHDPAEIWTNTQEVVAEALASSGLTAADLAAVGIATQMATSAVWDRNGKPLHNALVWQDTRTTEHVAAMTEDGGPDRFRAKTGLPLAPVFSSQLMRWLLNHLPDAREQAGSRNLLLGTIDGWLQWNLTGEHVTDVTNASITQLMNLATLDWDNELLEVFGIRVGPCRNSALKRDPRDRARRTSKACRSPALWATSSARWWDRPASSPERPKTLTERPACW